MKILVPVKRVVDHEVRVRILPDGSGLDVSGLRHSMNPFDEIALEEALRQREAGACDEVVIATCGTDDALETLRQGLALGADRAILIGHEGELQPLATARLLKALALREQPGLVLTGKQAIDDDSAQTGPMLAAMLGWPQACFASRVQLTGTAVEVEREVDGGHETLNLSLPALVTCDLRLNTPRFATLANTMKARRKEVERIAAQSFGLDLAPRLRTLRFEAPAARAPGRIVSTVEELAGHLRPFLPAAGEVRS